jgi:shikimate kinase
MVATQRMLESSGRSYEGLMSTDPQASRQASAARILALTGFMGAGKTCVGRALAALLGWRFVDLDQEIELQQKATVREIFRRQGEDRFREVERAALREMLEQASAPTVIALGGGTFVQPHNVDLLRGAGAQVVFLETPLDELLERCGAESQFSEENLRPLASDPDAFRALYAQRLPQYRTADFTLSTPGRTAEANAQEIASRLGLVRTPAV